MIVACFEQFQIRSIPAGGRGPNASRRLGESNQGGAQPPEEDGAPNAPPVTGLANPRIALLNDVRFDANARLLLLPRAIFADGFGTANGRIVEEKYHF